MENDAVEKTVKKEDCRKIQNFSKSENMKICARFLILHTTVVLYIILILLHVHGKLSTSCHLFRSPSKRHYLTFVALTMTTGNITVKNLLVIS